MNLFVEKAEQYARYRTDYPREVIDSALNAVQLGNDDVVADLGSGTGLLARWILARGNRVFGIEPDTGMRSVAERRLALPEFAFTSVAASAEATTLPEASVDVIMAGNAFHYFDPALARAEAERILRHRGRVLVIGHSNATRPNRFMEAYGRFLKSIAAPETWTFHQPDREESSLHSFFGAAVFHETSVVELSHPLSWDTLCGRFLSTSLAPSKSDPLRPGILAQLKSVFDEFAHDGTVEFQLSWGYAWGYLKP